MPEFVFMLTRDDVTIPDAREVFSRSAETGVRHFGCKDVGLPTTELRALFDDIRAAGHVSYLEVVAQTEAATLQSARVAGELEPDYLVGGTLIQPIQEVIAGSRTKFLPYVGRIVGHPCLLRGTIEEIVEDARRIEEFEVDGINLLAYRYDGDVPAMVRSVSESTSIPILAAGSVDSLDRVRELGGLGVWAFTVGTAALDGAFVDGGLERQLEAILDASQATPAA